MLAVRGVALGDEAGEGEAERARTVSEGEARGLAVMGAWPKRKRGDTTPFSRAELEVAWRPDPSFIGPVGPPMLLWLNDRDKQEKWKNRYIPRKALP